MVITKVSTRVKNCICHLDRILEKKFFRAGHLCGEIKVTYNFENVVSKVRKFELLF